MSHIEDEDIARMIDGNISKMEREDFLRHFSECDSCLSIYTDALEFLSPHDSPATSDFLSLDRVPRVKVFGDQFSFSHQKG